MSNKYQILNDTDLSQYSWFGIGGKAKNFFIPSDSDNLSDYLIENNSKNYFVLGSGSNVLFRDTGYSNLIIKLGKGFRNIEIKNNQLVVGAGVLKAQVSEFALKNKIKNFEFLCCIPGMVGGGVFMNAGCFGSDFSKIVKEVRGIYSNGNKNYLDKNKIGFDYRKTNLPEDFVITEVVFNIEDGNFDIINSMINEFKKIKSNSQPKNIKTGGSTFKNPQFSKKAWELIKESGCDKVKFGHAKFSSMHANFIDNSLKANSSDIEKLINYTIEQVNKKFNVILELEIKIIGD
ncbi:MAG: UDP-N-acetylmuramate dehydrogenase [Pelagibacteraceae bacterium]